MLFCSCEIEGRLERRLATLCRMRPPGGAKSDDGGHKHPLRCRFDQYRSLKTLATPKGRDTLGGRFYCSYIAQVHSNRNYFAFHLASRLNGSNSAQSQVRQTARYPGLEDAVPSFEPTAPSHAPGSEFAMTSFAANGVVVDDRRSIRGRGRTHTPAHRQDGPRRAGLRVAEHDLPAAPLLRRIRRTSLVVSGTAFGVVIAWPWRTNGPPMTSYRPESPSLSQSAAL